MGLLPSMAGMRAAARLLAPCAFALASTSAAAAGFDVNPIRIELDAKNRSAALSVRNTGTESIVVQVSAQAWSQKEGRDVLADTPDLIVSPPIATIAAGAEQVVRVGLRRAPDSQRELSYRIFIQEVPPPPKPGLQGLVVALRVGLPVFGQPRDAARATLVWNADMTSSGSVKLSVENKGNAHIQISAIDLFKPAEPAPVAEVSGMVYVLPGQAREWDVKPLKSGVKPGERLRMKVSTDAGSLDLEIELGSK